MKLIRFVLSSGDTEYINQEKIVKVYSRYCPNETVIVLDDGSSIGVSGDINNVVKSMEAQCE